MRVSARLHAIAAPAAHDWGHPPEHAIPDGSSARVAPQAAHPADAGVSFPVFPCPLRRPRPARHSPPPNPCPTGHVPGADGVCMPVGIQGCAEMFIDPETGLCDPRPEG